MVWGCDVGEVGIGLNLDSDCARDLWEEGAGGGVTEILWVVCKDGLGDGWEEEWSWDRSTARGGDRSEISGERVEAAEDNGAGVVTSVVASAETTGVALVFGVVSA